MTEMSTLNEEHAVAPEIYCVLCLHWVITRGVSAPPTIQKCISTLIDPRVSMSVLWDRRQNIF